MSNDKDLFGNPVDWNDDDYLIEIWNSDYQAAKRMHLVLGILLTTMAGLTLKLFGVM